MNATRYANRSTTGNLVALLEQIKSPSSDVRLFASHREMPKEEVGSRDRAPLSTNLPLLCALVHDGHRWIVYDGNFLMATRAPRASEVSELLDAAVEAGTVLFSTERVDFTGHTMTAEDAATYLKDRPTLPLTAKTRSTFGRMLSATADL